MEEELVNALNELVDDEFQNMKWFLKRVHWDGIPPIKPTQLQKADRNAVVDLMMQKYQLVEAVKVMQKILKKISRNDLVKDLQISLEENKDEGSAETDNTKVNEEKLDSVRSKFVDGVSEPVLHNLMDKLLEKKVLTDNELEFSGSRCRADKARMVIDTVRRKGPRASAALVAALCEVDSCLAEELKLSI